MTKQNVTTKSITQYLDEDYHEYAKYVIEHRAIPSVIDGFKPTQRKVIFVANRVWRKGNEKALKIFQLAGKVASDAHYHHGDGSLNAAIVGMAQKFKNSMPVLEEIGQFGSLRSPEAGAPRYISTKLHPNFRQLYMDFELLTPRYEEGTEIEPEYFLPIIPTVLLNGGSGIAVGFATNILNRNPIDLIDCCLKHLDNQSFKEPAPWYFGYFGERLQDLDRPSSWTFKGKFAVKNTTNVEVNDLPPSMTYEKFDTYLNKLSEENRVVDYENNCKSDINYVLKFKRKDLSDLEKDDRLSRFLKMEERQTENLTVLDENGNLRVFDRPAEIITYFVDFRLKYYDKRKAYLISTLENELMILSNRARFIKSIIGGNLKVNNIPKSQIILYLQTDNFDEVDGSYNYLLNMPIHTLTKEKYEELLANEHQKQIELAEIRKKEPLQMYKSDLLDLKKALSKIY